MIRMMKTQNDHNSAILKDTTSRFFNVNRSQWYLWDDVDHDVDDYNDDDVNDD